MCVMQPNEWLGDENDIYVVQSLDIFRSLIELISQIVSSLVNIVIMYDNDDEDSTMN